MTHLVRIGRFGLPALLVALAVLAAPAARASALAQGGETGLLDEGEYESPTFGYEVTWSEDWTADESSTTTSAAGDQLLLDSEDAFIFITGVAIEVAPADVVEATISDRETEPEIVDSDESDDLAWTLLAYELEDTLFNELIEARPLDGGVLVISLTAPEEIFEEVLGQTQERVTIDGDPLFASLAEEEDERGAEGDDAALASATSSIWGVSVSWDEEVWQLDEEASFVDDEAEQDLLVLRSDLSSLYLDAKAAYDGDPEVCLEEEAELLEEEDGIVAFDLAEGDDGPLTGTTEDGVVFGIYESTLEFEDDPETEEDESGEFELAIYLECRTLVEDEAVVAVTLITQPEDFEEQLALALEVIERIELPE